MITETKIRFNVSTGYFSIVSIWQFVLRQVYLSSLVKVMI